MTASIIHFHTAGKKWMCLTSTESCVSWNIQSSGCKGGVPLHLQDSCAVIFVNWSHSLSSVSGNDALHVKAPSSGLAHKFSYASYSQGLGGLSLTQPLYAIFTHLLIIYPQQKPTCIPGGAATWTAVAYWGLKRRLTNWLRKHGFTPLHAINNWKERIYFL